MRRDKNARRHRITVRKVDRAVGAFVCPGTKTASAARNQTEVPPQGTNRHAFFADTETKGIKGSELVVFETYAHAPIYESVAEFNEKTLNFLTRHTG